MKIVLKSILLCIGLLAYTFAECQIKVVERSAKKPPVWIGSTQQEFIITSAIKPDLESAKSQCLDNVKMQIIDAVAQNVNFTTETTINQSSNLSGITDFTDKFASKLRTQAANVPFIKGVSMSKVSESYWEKRVDKKTKEESYVYSIKYPLPSIELKKLAHEFEKQDKEMYNKYLTLAEQITKVASVEEISRSIAALDPLIAYFFDDVRKTGAESLKASYIKLFDNITVEEVSSKLGEARLSFMLEGRVITTSQRPTIKSECATNIKFKQDGTQYVVTYDYEHCDKEALNEISIAFRINNRTITHKIGFKVVDTAPKVYLTGDIYITADSVDTEQVKALTFRVNIKSENCSKFRVDEFIFNIPGVMGAVVVSDVNQEFVSSATHSCVVKYEGTINTSTSHRGLYNQMVGYMKGVMGDDSIPYNIRFVLPFKSNW